MYIIVNGHAVEVEPENKLMYKDKAGNFYSPEPGEVMNRPPRFNPGDEIHSTRTDYRKTVEALKIVGGSYRVVSTDGVEDREENKYLELVHKPQKFFYTAQGEQYEVVAETNGVFLIKAVGCCS